MTQCTAAPPVQQSELRFVPSTVIHETANAWDVVCEVPGAQDDAADVSLEPEQLVINIRVQPTELTGFQLARQGFREGDYRQVLKLPQNIDRQAVTATLRHGVLRLHLPKLPTAQSRKVSVVSGPPA